MKKITGSKQLKTQVLFNGDADGLCAQHIAFLSGIRPDLLLSGVKRDLSLLARADLEKPSKILGFDLNLVDFVVMILQLFHSFVAGLLDIDARDTGDGDRNWVD